MIDEQHYINIRNITGIVMNLKVAMSVSNCLCSPRGTEQSETVYMVLNLIRVVLVFIDTLIILKIQRNLY